MTGLINAPFTPEQVHHLNIWQSTGYVHPFTCRCRTPETGEVVLTATVDGWVCPRGCGYTQAWAHDFMAEPMFPNPLRGPT